MVVARDPCETPLAAAASQGYEAIVSLLLDRGADVGARDSEWGTPLIAALYKGHVDTAILLLKRGANIRDVAPLLDPPPTKNSHQPPQGIGEVAELNTDHYSLPSRPTEWMALLLAQSKADILISLSFIFVFCAWSVLG